MQPSQPVSNEGAAVHGFTPTTQAISRGTTAVIRHESDEDYSFDIARAVGTLNNTGATAV